MFELVTKLILHRQLKMEKGEINLLGQRIVMLPMISLVQLQKKLEDDGYQYNIYKLLKEFGINWAKDLATKYKFKSSDIFEWGSKSVTLAGWGDVLVVSADVENKVIKFRLMNSAVVEFYGKSEVPVDHFFRGMVAGAMSAVYGVDMDCVETSCKALGAQFCEFVVKSSNSFDMSNELVRKQLS